MGGRRLLWLNVGMKALLVGLLLFSVFSDLERFNGKAMTARALAYPLAALIVPVAWRLRGRPQPYPHLIDTLVVLPFVIDTGGNVLDLYSIWWFASRRGRSPSGSALRPRSSGSSPSTR